MNNDLQRIGVVFTSEGEVDFKKTMQEINLALNENYNQFKLAQSQWDESTTKIQKLREQQEYLQNAYEIQGDKVKTLRMQLSDLENAENKNTTAIKKKRNELLNAEIQLKNYDNRLKNTNTELNNTEKGIKTTAERIEELDEKMKENENTFKLTQSQYTAMTSKSQKLNDEQKYLTNEYNLQKEKIELLNKQLEELENAEDKNTIAISKKRAELAQAETNLNNYNTKLKIVSNQLENSSAKAIVFGENIENVGNKVEKVGKKVSAFSLATGTAFVTSAKNAIDFEDAFVGVEKTVDGTEEQMAELKQGIRDLAKEIPSTTTEISAVAEATGQLGIKTEDILSFTKVMIDLGNSTNLSAEEAASSLAKFANITKMSAKDYSKLGSTVVALGNNFATTEADIVAMAQNLASTGTQVGMSQSDIMALATALSSVGLEAQAGGTAFSKALSKIQLAVETNSENLKKWADVAGMSTQDFAKLFKEDATEALKVFIQGLSKCGGETESAIKVLDDMGITETRMRDALLRSANASETFTKALKIGNEAWEDNTALTNEANRRYNDLKSKIAIVLNKLKDMSVSLGNRLMPSIEKIITKLENWIEKFQSLSDEEVDMIVKIGLIVTAIGTLITIVGKVISTFGGLTKGIGTVVQAIGVMNGNVTTTSVAVQKLVSIFGAISANPIVAVTTATTLATAAVIAYKAEQMKEQAALNGVTESIEQQKDKMNELAEIRNQSIENSSNEIIITQELADELRKITDENGKVKEGYENRANYILTELNKALGTEYSLNGNIISQYKDLAENIDTLIAKKKAEAVLNAYQNEYGEAIKKQSEATQNLISLKQQLAEAQDKLLKSNGIEAQETRMLISKITQEIGEQSSLISQYGKTIIDYENLQTESVKGSADEINKAVSEIGISWQKAKEQSEESIETQIKTQTEYVKELKKSYKDAQEANDKYLSTILEKQLKTEEEQLVNLAKNLSQQTSTIKNLTPEQISAWQDIANQSLSAYSIGLSLLPQETQKQIQNATGIINNDTALQTAAQEKGTIASGLYANKFLLYGTTQEEIDKAANAIKNDTTVENATSQLADNATKGWKSIINPSKWASDLIEQLAGGMSSDKSQGIISKAAKGVAGVISSFLHFSLPEKGPLSDMDKSMPDMIDMMSKGIDKNKSKLIKSTKSMAQDVNDELNNINSNQNLAQQNISNINNTNSQIDYDKMANAMLRALTNCKFTLDDEGFAKIVKEELYKVV